MWSNTFPSCIRILVTGSRDWVDRVIIENAIKFHTTGIDPKNVTIVHGGAFGADQISAEVAKSLGMIVEEHPAIWGDCGDNCGPTHFRYRPSGEPYCPRAGFVRNSLMVSLGADLGLAFIRNESKGSMMAARLAERAGIPVHRYVRTDEYA